MSRNRERASTRPSELEEARNELFSHIHRCGVLRASAEQQEEWMKDTIEFLGERFTTLDEEALEELKAIGLRFCRPVIVNYQAEEDAAAEGEDAGQAVAEEATAA